MENSNNDEPAKKLSTEVKEENFMKSMEKMDNSIDQYIDEGVKKKQYFSTDL